MYLIILVKQKYGLTLKSQYSIRNYGLHYVDNYGENLTIYSPLYRGHISLAETFFENQWSPLQRSSTLFDVALYLDNTYCVKTCTFQTFNSHQSLSYFQVRVSQFGVWKREGDVSRRNLYKCNMGKGGSKQTFCK